ncbi:MAG: CRISPR-associated protein [Calothrix sp. MO_167.B42]|nr:CRISPR-associated protein [Calothrix sp. MO_167.B42]
MKKLIVGFTTLSLSRAIKPFFEPDTIVPFLIGTVFLSVTGNAISDILKQLIGEDVQSLTRIIIVSIIIFITCVWLVSKSLKKSAKQFDLSRANPQQHKGLILLVSREEPCRKAIEHHLPKLKYCWLIHSSQSAPIVKNLQKDYPQVSFANPEQLIVNDIFDPIKFIDLVTEIYKKLPNNCHKDEVIGDFTGMTAQGSVGMAIASLLMHKTKLQYTPVAMQNGKPSHSLTPIEILLTEKRMLRKSWRIFRNIMS